MSFPNHELTTLINLNEETDVGDSICNYLNTVTNSSKFSDDLIDEPGLLEKRILKNNVCICSWSSKEWEPINKLYDRILKTIKNEELLHKLELLEK